MPETCAGTISGKSQSSILYNMQSSFSTSMTAMTFKRGGTGNGMALRLEYLAVPKPVNRQETNDSNGPTQLQKQAVSQKSPESRKGDLPGTRPPVRWGINE
jgi:hypothetical protein